MPTHPRSVRHDAASSRRTACMGLLLAAALITPCPVHAQSTVQAGTPSIPTQIVGAFDTMFDGPHAGQRAVHAKGLLCEGSFIPAPAAVALSRAVHLQGAEVPVLARFSNFAAIPGLPDGNPASSPHGLALRFLLPDGGDTDIVAHSYDGFPAGTPEEFLAFLRATLDPAALAIFAAGHPAARAFLEHPKPTPASYATEEYFGVNAFRFTDTTGMTRHGRYRFVPLAGMSHLDAEEAAGRAPDFLAEEMAERMQRGPVTFRLVVQLAGEGDTVTDGSVAWPAERQVVELGTVSLHVLAPDQAAAQRGLRIVPTNLVDGIAPSADPMLVARTQAYDISAERRVGPE